MEFLYHIYEKNIIQINRFIKKYKINISFLYYLLKFIKKVNERLYTQNVILYENKCIFYNKIYEHIEKTKYERLYKYIYKIYNTNYINIFKVFKVKDFNIVKNPDPKLICYKILKLKPEERKQKKKIQKFNIKYNKLKQINEEYYEWINKNLKTDFFKDKIKDIIDEQMKYLDKSIKDNGKNIDFIRNTYRTIYSYLCNSWEFIIIDNELERHDFKIVYNSDTWKKYGVHENEEYKRVFKI
jgi:hypothetical protein